MTMRTSNQRLDVDGDGELNLSRMGAEGFSTRHATSALIWKATYRDLHTYLAYLAGMNPIPIQFIQAKSSTLPRSTISQVNKYQTITVLSFEHREKTGL